MDTEGVKDSSCLLARTRMRTGADGLYGGCDMHRMVHCLLTCGRLPVLHARVPACMQLHVQPAGALAGCIRMVARVQPLLAGAH